MRAFQRVKKILKNINPLIKNYLICLMVVRGRKNCAAMAKSTNIPEKFLYSFLNDAKNVTGEMDDMLLQLTHKPQLEKSPKAFGVDPTHIIKPYARYIEKLCYDRAGTSKRVEHCLVPIYAMVMDRFATIPLAMKFWIQENLTGKRHYKTKAKLTMALISEARKNKVKFDFVPLDGGYAVPEMLDFFAETKESFVMRIPKSRVITTSDGIRAQLKNHPALKLHRNEREKVVQAKLKGRTYFFVAYKRKDKDGGYETVYLISNMNKPAKELIVAYNMRWPLEKVIRTTKQKFGAMQCQALEIEKQQAHLTAGVLAYAILETANIDKQEKSVDALVNFIRDEHAVDLIMLIENPCKINRRGRPRLDAKPLQNPIYYAKKNADSSVSLRN